MNASTIEATLRELGSADVVAPDLDALEARLRVALESADGPIDLGERRRRRVRPLVLGAAAACLIALVVLAAGWFAAGDDRYVLADAVDVEVVLPDGDVVEGRAGLELPVGAVLDVGGRMEIDGITYGPGDYVITDAGPVLVDDSGAAGGGGDDRGVGGDGGDAPAVGDVPSTTRRDRPTTTVGDRPTTTVGDRPTTTVRDRPTTTVRDRPTTTVFDRPTTTVLDRPTTTVFDRPTTTVLDDRPRDGSPPNTQDPPGDAPTSTRPADRPSSTSVPTDSHPTTTPPRDPPPSTVPRHQSTTTTTTPRDRG